MTDESFEYYTQKEMDMIDNCKRICGDMLDDEEIYDLMVKLDMNETRIKNEISETVNKLKKKGDDYNWTEVNKKKENKNQVQKEYNDRKDGTKTNNYDNYENRNVNYKYNNNYSYKYDDNYNNYNQESTVEENSAPVENTRGGYNKYRGGSSNYRGQSTNYRGNYRGRGGRTYDGDWKRNTNNDENKDLENTDNQNNIESKENQAETEEGEIKENNNVEGGYNNYSNKYYYNNNYNKNYKQESYYKSNYYNKNSYDNYYKNKQEFKRSEHSKANNENTTTVTTELVEENKVAVTENNFKNNDTIEENKTQHVEQHQEPKREFDTLKDIEFNTENFTEVISENKIKEETSHTPTQNNNTSNTINTISREKSNKKIVDMVVNSLNFNSDEENRQNNKLNELNSVNKNVNIIASVDHHEITQKSNTNKLNNDIYPPWEASSFHKVSVCSDVNKIQIFGQINPFKNQMNNFNQQFQQSMMDPNMLNQGGLQNNNFNPMMNMMGLMNMNQMMMNQQQNHNPLNNPPNLGNMGTMPNMGMMGPMGVHPDDSNKFNYGNYNNNDGNRKY
jgi:hypothetical protein